MSEIIRVEHVSYVYNPGMPDATKALDDVSFSIQEGDFVGVIGSTGSGKSTLISHFNGLNRPTSGKIFVDGRDMWAEGEDLRSFRFLVGLVFGYAAMEYSIYVSMVLHVMNNLLFGDMFTRLLKGMPESGQQLVYVL